MKKEVCNYSANVGLWSALAGGALGFTLGLLVAPERGRQVRRRLAYQLERFAGTMTNFVQEVIGPEVDSEARRTGDALVADAQARADHIRSDIDALLEELREHEEDASDASTD